MPCTLYLGLRRGYEQLKIAALIYYLRSVIYHALLTFSTSFTRRLILPHCGVRFCSNDFSTIRTAGSVHFSVEYGFLWGTLEVSAQVYTLDYAASYQGCPLDLYADRLPSPRRENLVPCNNRWNYVVTVMNSLLWFLFFSLR